VAFLPAEFIKIRANYAEGFLMPTARQLSSDLPTYCGNPNLKPETSKTSEIGIDLSYEEFNVSATFFHTDSTNLISTGFSDDGRQTPVNVGKAVRQGYEFSANADLGNRLWGSGYSFRPYVNLTVMTKYWDKTANRKLSDVSDVMVGYGATFATPENDLTVSLSAQYFGAQINRVTAGETLFGKYNFVDLNITKKIMKFGERGDVTLKAAINNVTNAYYLLYPEYPNPGRNFYIALAFDY
jgi:vitamin B12 transporter